MMSIPDKFINLSVSSFASCGKTIQRPKFVTDYTWKIRKNELPEKRPYFPQSPQVIGHLTCQ